MALWNRNAPGGKADAAGTPAGKPERRVERHAAKQALKTSMGRAVDLSSGGARIKCEQKPDLKVQAAAPLEIFLLTGSEVVNTRVCWIKKRGLYKGHWEIGLKFIAVPADQQKRLTLIAQKGFLPAEEDREAPPAAERPEASVAKLAPDANLVALREHFDELELPVEATADEVRAAHRRLVRVCHPDVARGDEAAAHFLRLQASYQILIDAFRERDDRLAAAA